MRFLLSINQSLNAIRTNLFRAGVTIFIIALGITALILVMTSIEGIKQGMMTSFSSLGANNFRIINRSSSVRFGQKGRNRRKKFPVITYLEAAAFQKEFEDNTIVSITGSGGGANEVKSQTERSNPNIKMDGGDQYYNQVASMDLASGRSLTQEDVALARNVTILGSELAETLFPFEDPLGKTVQTNGHTYRVVGIFESKGATGFSGGADRSMLIPITTLRNHDTNPGSFTINVFVSDTRHIDYLMEEARGRFRQIRKLRLQDLDNFSVIKSDEIINQFLQQISFLTISAQIIAFITLLGASVALLNVMLVSVTERTNEIGLRKAMGATKRNILLQFLMEAVVICQVGGFIGIGMGLGLGNLVSSLVFKGEFVIPWLWVIIGTVACFIVGVSSGYYPARKAAKVDPIESLRYE